MRVARSGGSRNGVRDVVVFQVEKNFSAFADDLSYQLRVLDENNTLPSLNILPDFSADRQSLTPRTGADVKARQSNRELLLQLFCP